MIVDGAPVALDGYKTSCGAVLIASQQPTYKDMGGGNASSNNSSDAFASLFSPYVAEEDDVGIKYDLFFHAKYAKTGRNASNARYKITLDDGREFEGVTDENGHTEKVFSNSAQIAKIEVPYYDDSTTNTCNNSEPCGC